MVVNTIFLMFNTRCFRIEYYMCFISVENDQEYLVFYTFSSNMELNNRRINRNPPALQIQPTYPFSSLSSCCCRRSLRKACRFSTRSRSRANSLKTSIHRTVHTTVHTLVHKHRYIQQYIE